MTIDEARALYARHSGGDASHYDAFGIAQISDYFEDASPADKAAIWDLFVTFALEGDRGELSLARRFLFNKAAPAAHYTPMVQAATSGNHPNQAGIEAILGAWPANLGDADRAALTQTFLADPVAHFSLAPNLVRKEPRGPAWDAYAAALEQIEDLQILAAGYEAASLASRQFDYATIIARRPPELVRALAPLLPSDASEHVLKVAGVS
jgi:hypothetical protein